VQKTCSPSPGSVLAPQSSKRLSELTETYLRTANLNDARLEQGCFVGKKRRNLL
jgi:hypothetical protein